MWRNNLVERKSRSAVGVLLFELNAELLNTLEIIETVRLLQLFSIREIVFQFENFRLSNVLHTHKSVDRLKRQLDFLQIILGV